MYTVYGMLCTVCCIRYASRRIWAIYTELSAIHFRNELTLVKTSG